MKADEPVFPMKKIVQVEEPRVAGISTAEMEFYGLTKREYAAIMAMQGLLADPEGRVYDKVPKIAVELADALLAELEKK